MKKLCALLALVSLLSVGAQAQKRERERLRRSGEVLKEVLNVPEDLPKYWLNRAECVVVFPSVVKLAFIVGASYGRGVMTCRSGANFTGPWGPPAMYALEG